MNKAAHWKTTSPLIQMTSRHSDRSAPRLHLAPFLLLAPCLRVRVHLQPRPSYEIPCRHRRSSISPIRDAFPRLLLCRFASPSPYSVNTVQTLRPARLQRRVNALRWYSTGFSSVHRERPSPEYAKRKKESLESEFRQMVGTFGAKNLFTYYRFGPFLALYRVAIISFQVAKLTVWHFFLRDIHKRASKFWETLIRLGPFYIKLVELLLFIVIPIKLIPIFFASC
ncbi:hypothetical protein IHE45_06G034900 [Dioscorea alata]|uniref:Uncharacterized protein n=1 Tax=Dioscorea alata TaxID=55571 RepID=A0ACB7VWG4_DIOAL|nr:hypothetical protein IHE45_06G034900 [Dioscorea alata]